MESRWIRLAEDVTACAIDGLSEPISGVAYVQLDITYVI